MHIALYILYLCPDLGTLTEADANNTFSEDRTFFFIHKDQSYGFFFAIRIDWFFTCNA